MGNRYGPRADEFEWTLGNRRRLARYLGSELTYAETAMLLGTTRGSVAAQAAKQKIARLTPEQLAERNQRKGYETAVHGRREAWNTGRSDRQFIEPWVEFSARRKRERAALRETSASNP